MKEIHALSIKKALTPKQWSEQKPAVESKAVAPEVLVPEVATAAV
jgi:hypothetical protein